MLFTIWSRVINMAAINNNGIWKTPPPYPSRIKKKIIVQNKIRIREHINANIQWINCLS
jgi:hypothetical protein